MIHLLTIDPNPVWNCLQWGFKNGGEFLLGLLVGLNGIVVFRRIAGADSR